ncbi:hypothetical protein BP6252_12068 [Coleophoma cylindrospora]|uniref:Rhodopsin domain-containing protein n=1 Tax=Coleophoma cylindrospora TaxID=1849047 RepID=A0A3D8QFV4_9HELO|nr:hypothetical protein BP6252_12068 [Coleophoma cylindrospora]
MIGLCLCYGFVFVGISVFQCQPIAGAWEQWDGTWEGTCNNINLQGWASAVINIIFDVITLSLPLVPLWKLNMALRKKIQVMIMFSVGFFVTVISILRLYSLLAFGSSTNITWVYVPVSYWTTIEIYVGIMCVCMPAIQPLLRKVFPRALSLGTTQNTGHGSKGLSSANSKFSPKPHVNRLGHRELHSHDDLGTFDEEASTVQLVTIETKDALHHDVRPGTAV